MGGFSNVLGSLAVVITGDIDDYLSDLGQVTDAAAKAVSDVEKQFSGLTEVGTQMAGLGAGLTAGITAPLGLIAGLSIDAAKDMDSLTRGLTAVAGSSDEAARQMGRLQEVAKLPGLGLEEAVQGSIRLQAVGVAATDAERYMMQFGNALATVGKGRADLDAVITQLVQMSTKTKVVSEDLRPVMERVPQVASILKDAYGTIDTEQLAKAGKTTQEVIGTIIGGLEKLPRVSGGIGNAFENLEDSSKRALGEVGKAFTPLIEKVVPVLETILAKVQEVAKWFADLPAPVQAAIGTLVAFAAAIGPVLTAIGGITAAIGLAMPALTAVAGFFGTSVALLAPWALGIAAALAALVALGVWVNENWEPIVAVLSAAWDGVQENWTAVWNAITDFLTGAWEAIAAVVDVLWGPIVKFFSTVWDAVAPYFSKIWDGIKGTLEGVWNAIKGAASAVWGGIVSVFQTFLEWAAKIPGAAKLMNLDDAWRSAKQASAELDKTAKATENVGKAAAAAAPKIRLATGENDKAAKAAGKHARAVADAWDAAYKRYDDAAKDAEKNRLWFESAYQKIEQLDRQLEASAGKLATEFAKAHADMQAAATKTVDIIVPLTQRIPPEVQATIKANQDLEAAYKQLGVTSAAELNKQYGAAKDAYDKITASGTASARDIDAAWVAMEERRQAAAVAAGESIPAEQQKMLDRMKDQLDTSTTKQSDKWSEWSKQVSTIVTDLGRDLAGILFDGDLSWAEKGQKALDAIGQAFTRAFIEPATNAIADFVSGALADLLGGKGFGGLIDRVKGIGDAIGGIFGGKGGGGGVSIPGVGGGGGGGGAGGSIASGITGGLIGLAGDVLNFIGTMRTEGTLNQIERNTAAASIHLRHILEDGVNQWLPKLAEIAGFNWDVFQPALASLMSTVESIQSGSGAVVDRLQEWLKPIYTESFGKWQLYEDRLYEISSNTFLTMDAARANGQILAQIRDSLMNRGPAVVINVNGAAGPQATADAVALKLQGIML